MRQSSNSHPPIGHQNTRLLPRSQLSLKLNSSVKEPPLSCVKKHPPVLKRPPPCISAFDLRGIHPSTSSSALSSTSIFTPVLQASRSQSPRGIPRNHEVDALRKQLENLEAKFTSVSTRFREQSEMHACDKARADRWERECERMQALLDSKKSCVDVAVQTLEIVVPSPTPPPLLSLVVRRPSPLPTRRPSPEAVSIGTSPLRVTAHVSNSPARRTPPRWNTSPVITKADPPSERPRRPSVSPVPALVPASSISIQAKQLLDNLTEHAHGVHAHFDRLDCSKTGYLNRDLCLGMISLIFEENKIHRSANIPKVICSRMLRSVANSGGGVATNRSTGSSHTTSLHREDLLEFMKLVLQFVIDEERSSSIALNSSSAG